MSRKRRIFSGAFKSKVALAAVNGDKTTAELASKFAVHASQVTAWKKQFLVQVATLFEDRRGSSQESGANEEELFAQIGGLNMEVEWLKRNLPSSADQKRALIEPANPRLSIARQCKILNMSRSTCYYLPTGESDENLELMRRIDEVYLRWPFYGSRKIALELEVNRKRVQRLMRLMGIEVIGPKRRTTRAAAGHRKFPYLLRNLEITQPNHVWSTDITYVPMRHGFLYLVAVMDCFSRYVLAWRLSNTLDGGFCLAALNDALSQCQPEIFNSDQGSQFTSTVFTSRLESAGIAVSMDGRSRALDNVFIERLWRSVKYEEVYRREYVDG